ncbi:MAG: lipid A export permease/ATP-binding protein MsbA [Gammaproteobacteria bacterium]|nr:lipid A export permease/ATP-binding protein MsbA [Gammaproteobacteria bacterium]
MTDDTEIHDGLVIYRRLLAYARSYVGIFALAALAMVIQAATNASLSVVMKPMLDGSFVDKDPFWIGLIPLALIAIAVVRGASGFAVTYLMSWIGRQVIRRLRGEIFDRLLRLPAAYFDRSSTGTLVSKMTFDVEQVSMAVTQTIKILILDLLTVLFLLGWMFYLNWKLSLLFFLLGPVVAGLVLYVNRRFRRISTRIQNSMGDVTQVTEQAIAGHRIVRIFGGRVQENHVFSRANELNQKQNMKLTVTGETSVQVIQLVVALCLAGVIYLSTVNTMLASISVGTFVSFIMAMMMLLSPIKRLTTVNAALQRGISAAQSIFTLIDHPCEQDSGTRCIERVRGEVEYRDVSFSYDDSKGDVLRHINLRVLPGQSVAFVGRSGSGKSTLVNLLPRFYELQQGQLLLDGIDIRELTLDSLRDQIALVSQEVTLFNDTIANNIAYGKLATASREHILQVAQAARLMEFIERLPQGLDTVIGERGMLLSGGQRQRIAIARALLKDAPILILDEATSALDTESERYIQAALEALMKNRTTFVIAHRLSTIESCDIIHAMEQGRIVESGTHRELLARGGYYASLYAMQFSASPDPVVLAD